MCNFRLFHVLPHHTQFKYVFVLILVSIVVNSESALEFIISFLLGGCELVSLIVYSFKRLLSFVVVDIMDNGVAVASSIDSLVGLLSFNWDLDFLCCCCCPIEGGCIS